MLKLVFNNKIYRILDYDLSLQNPSTKSTVESFGGFTTVYTVYGDSKESYTIKISFRDRATLNSFKNDLFAPDIKSFTMQEYNDDAKLFETVGEYTFTGNYTEKIVSDPVRKFKREISFSFKRII